MKNLNRILLFLTLIASFSELCYGQRTRKFEQNISVNSTQTNLIGNWVSTEDGKYKIKYTSNVFYEYYDNAPLDSSGYVIRKDSSGASIQLKDRSL